MGNNASKDERRPSLPGSRHASTTAALARPTSPSHQTPADRLTTQIYASRNTSGRGSRHDLSFLTIGRDRGGNDQAAERPRETKQEREARKVERERQARLKERERSIREEGVDGGYLVTLGVYTGPEDFNKGIVRQLQIERRLAPFWKGLNDHSDSWTEAQLVAAVRGLPIPAADEVPAYVQQQSASLENSNSKGSDVNLKNLTVPITSRSQSYQSDNSAPISPSHRAGSSSGPASPTSPTSSAGLLRGRAKTLASLATGSRTSTPDMTPREIQLPKDPYVNGLPLEAYLYREVLECPICFMYYPPFLNKTRCCDQPICSECFVQIKRPDPHPPEHEQPGQPRPPEEEAEMLVSEVASCPFCVTPEFGVTYEHPPFRRGLAYANQTNGHPFRSMNSPMSSTSSLQSGAGRRRATSLSASDPQVVTTDKIRPDWAKKLADARAHALRRSAAATALHNAAYVLGNQSDVSRGGLLGRRRRTLFVDSPGASGSGTPREGKADSPSGDASSDLFPGRSSSRRNRVDDLEDLMMMEAIRLSLAAEEERKRREEKDARKEQKKKAREEKKAAKQAEKAARKRNGTSSLYHAGTNDSSSSWASTINEPLKRGSDSSASGKNLPNPIEHPQKHLEASRANLQPTSSTPIPMPSPRSPHIRQLSNASSAASSFVESPYGSVKGDSNLPSGSGSNLDVTAGGLDGSPMLTPAGGSTPTIEPMFNFRSLAAMIGDEDKARESE
ncbi:hypothetical protein M433DRAFT_34724, partial [Acidomyces richmondensis BFW]